MTFGGKIRKLRKQRKLSMKAFSKKSNISFHTIVSLELDRSTIPNIVTVKRMAKFFKISIDELVKGVKFE